MSKKENKVTIVPDENGNVIRQTKNPDYGYVIVAQESTKLTLSGSTTWIKNITKKARIMGEIDALKSQGYSKSKKLEGNVVIKEQLTPFDEADPERSIKRAGADGPILCTADGEPIHRITFYDETGLISDELVAHANGAAVREAYLNGAEQIAKDEFKSENTEDSLDITEEAEEEQEISSEIVEEEEVVEEVEEDEDAFEL